jgi:hypothetical protein
MWQFTPVTVGLCPDHYIPPLWCIGFSYSVHWLSYTKYIMCKLSFILVNENSSILSLMFLFSSIFSTTVYVNCQLDLLCVGSTHLHDSHAVGIDSFEKPRWIGRKPKFPCKLCKGDHLTHLCPSLLEA